MLKSLSILIPTFNDVCVELVKTLHVQASNIKNLVFEIIVADDGSTDNIVIERNKEIVNLSYCQYFVSNKNRGRAAIRNFLAYKAKYEWLLFIDSDMVVCNDNYIYNYIYMPNISTIDVVYGGYVINGDKQRLKGNLRYLYESKYKENSDAKKRNIHPYKNFHTSNFIAKRSIMLNHPFDERFRHYGYEDVIWGKVLKKSCIRITHTNNPLSFEIFEDNASFLAKTEEGIYTLNKFKEELEKYSNIITFACKMQKFHIDTLFNTLFKISRKAIKHNLLSNKPSVFLFNIYKIGMYFKFSEK